MIEFGLFARRIVDGAALIGGDARHSGVADASDASCAAAADRRRTHAAAASHHSGTKQIMTISCLIFAKSVAGYDD
jgi:hypothetical protein